MSTIPASCDVVVIGGGPAGSIASGLLAQQGYSIVLLEKAKHPRNTVGESLLPHFWRFTDRLKHASERLEAANFVGKSGAMTLWNGVFRRTSFKDFGHKRMAIHADRGEFDQILLNCSADAGTQVFEEVGVTKVEVSDVERKVVHYKAKADGAQGSIACKYIVDASGQSAVVAKQLGFRTFDEALKFTSVWGYFTGGDMMGFEAKILPVSQRFAEKPLTFISTIGDWAWLWHIVLKESVSVGVTLPPERLKAFRTPDGKDGIEDKFRALVAGTPGTGRLTREAKFIEGSVSVIRDYAYKPVNLATHGCFLVGDAAAFVDPINSAGVTFAMYAGFLASWCVGKSLQRSHERDHYEKLFQSEYAHRLSVFRVLAIPSDREPDDSEALMAEVEQAVKLHSISEQRLMLATSLLTNRPARVRKVLQHLGVAEESLFKTMPAPAGL